MEFATNAITGGQLNSLVKRLMEAMNIADPKEAVRRMNAGEWTALPVKSQSTSKEIEIVDSELKAALLPPLKQLLGSKFLFSAHNCSPISGFVEGVVAHQIGNIEIVSSALKADREGDDGKLFVSDGEAARMLFYGDVQERLVGKLTIL